MARILVASAGRLDNYGGHLFVQVNGESIRVPGVPAKRGITVFVLDPATWALQTKRNFDTYWWGEGSTRGSDELVAFLAEQPLGAVLVMGVADSADHQLTEEAKKALEALGSTRIRSIGFRQGWAFVTRVGGASGAEALAPAEGKEARLDVQLKTLSVVSAGHDDGNLARLELDGEPLTSLSGRGILLVAMDPETFRVHSQGIYDTYWSSTPGDASRRMLRDLETIPDGMLVLAAIRDAGARELSKDLIRWFMGVMGSNGVRQLGYRDSWAFAGIKGGPLVGDMHTRRNKGPAHVHAFLDATTWSETLRPPPPELQATALAEDPGALGALLQNDAIAVGGLLRDTLSRALEMPGGTLTFEGGTQVLQRRGDLTVLGQTAHVWARVELRPAGSPFSPAEGRVRALLRIYVPGQLAPSRVIAGLLWDQDANPTALDFLALDHPVLYLSTAALTIRDTELDAALVAAGIDTHGRYPVGRPVVHGLTLFAGGPQAEDLNAFPRSITRPLKWLMEDFKLDPSLLELSVDQTQATAWFSPVQDDWWLRTDVLSVRTFNRQVAVELERAQVGRQGGSQARSAPESTDAQGGRSKIERQKVAVEMDLDVTVGDWINATGLLEGDTAPLHVGLSVERTEQSTAALGWLQLRPDAAPWSRPFGIPGLTLNALFARVDLAQRKIETLHGAGRFCDLEAEVALRVSATRNENLVAARTIEDLPLLGLAVQLLGGDGSGIGSALGGLKIKGLLGRYPPVRTGLIPSDYNVYAVLEEQVIEGRTYPPGLGLRGTLVLWNAVSLQVALGVTWGDTLKIRGAVAKLSLGGGMFSIDLGGVGNLADQMPLEIHVNRDWSGAVRLRYNLSVLGLPAVQGHLSIGGHAASIPLPGPMQGGLFGGTPRVRIDRVQTAGTTFGELGVDGQIAVTYGVPLPRELHAGVALLPSSKDVSVTGTLLFKSARLTADTLSADFSIQGHIPLINRADILHLGRIGIPIGELRDGAKGLVKRVKEALSDWVAQELKKLVGDIPLLGPALVALYGFTTDTLARLFTALDSVGVPVDLKDAMGAVGVVADQADRVLASAMDWARGAGVPLGKGAGSQAVDAVASGLTSGFSFAAGALKSVPGYNDVAGWIGGGSKEWHPPKEDLDNASVAAGDAGVALLYDAAELGGQVYSFPLGRYARLPGVLRPGSGKGNGTNSLVLPRGWTIQIWSQENFVGPYEWIDLTTNRMPPGWSDRIASMHIQPMGNVRFYERSYFRGDLMGNAGVGQGTYTPSWANAIDSMLIPPGWEVVLERSDGQTKLVQNSQARARWMYGKEFMNGVTRFTIRYTAPPPAQWL